MTPLCYWSVNGEHVIFNKYTIDENGIIRNNKTGKYLRYSKDKNGYNKCCVLNDSGYTRMIYVGRALVSTFNGSPPTPQHTADHEDQNRGNDTVVNVRWLCSSGQRNNQSRPQQVKSSFIVVKDGIEKTVKEWAEHLKGEKNSRGCVYTVAMLMKYAQNKQYGFSYKKYQDLPEEVWKEIIGSKNKLNHWEISNMSRVKFVTKFAENVLYGERLGVRSGYPRIKFSGKSWNCHVLAFMTFFPEEYAAKKPNEVVLHEEDDRGDFRPHKLRLGTQSENITDAHSNGCYAGMQKARSKCASYINDILENEYESQVDAVKYLKSLGYDKVSSGSICQGLQASRKGKIIMRYGRTWKLV